MLSAVVLVQEIRAPIDTVWSVVRRFDTPQTYKHFLKSCDVISGECVWSPSATNDERLEIPGSDRRESGSRREK